MTEYRLFQIGMYSWAIFILSVSTKSFNLTLPIGSGVNFVEYTPILSLISFVISIVFPIPYIRKLPRQPRLVILNVFSATVVGIAILGVYFNIFKPTITLVIKLNGSGTVISSPIGILCGQNCKAVFEKSTIVKLNALPDRGDEFRGWDGPCHQQKALCVLKPESDVGIEARFYTPQKFKVSISRSGDGVVSSVPLGINCGLICIADFKESTSLVLNAIPNLDQVFKGWEGDCSGTLPTCTVGLSQNMVIKAVFAIKSTSLLIPPQPTISKPSTETVTPSKPSLNNSTTNSLSSEDLTFVIARLDKIMLNALQNNDPSQLNYVLDPNPNGSEYERVINLIYDQTILGCRLQIQVKSIPKIQQQLLNDKQAVVDIARKWNIQNICDKSIENIGLVYFVLKTSLRRTIAGWKVTATSMTYPFGPRPNYL